MMNKGTLHKAASSVLVQLRYAARMTRLDLLRPTTRRVSYDTKWTPYRDKQLYRLVCDSWSTLDYMQGGYISSRGAHILQAVAFADADFAGCVETRRPTTGGGLCMAYPSSQGPLHSLSKRQDSAESSTHDAKPVAPYTVDRTLLIPCLDMWEVLVQRWKRGIVVSDVHTMHPVLG